MLNRRYYELMKLADAKRALVCDRTEAFDPVRFIEHSLPKQVRNFDYHYDEEHEEFIAHPQKRAFVDFTDGQCLLVARESVLTGALDFDHEDRFVLAHEIGHVFLHRGSAQKLARHKTGSKLQYEYREKLEYEANTFAGSLLVPPDGVTPLMTTFDIKLRFKCSYQVAQRAKTDIDRYWRKG